MRGRQGRRLPPPAPRFGPPRAAVVGGRGRGGRGGRGPRHPCPAFVNDRVPRWSLTLRDAPAGTAPRWRSCPTPVQDWQGGPARLLVWGPLCADLLQGVRSTRPLLPSKCCGTALWDVHILLRLDHNSPHKSALEASYIHRPPP